MLESYPKLRVAIDLVLLTAVDIGESNLRKVSSKGIQIMLVKRDIDPFNGQWVLPGAFVDYDKTITDCVNTKVLEKTGLSGIYTEQLYTYGDKVDRDPRDRVISIGYIGLLDRPRLSTFESVNNAAWFWVNPIRKNNLVVDIRVTDMSGNDIGELGFDHKDIIIDAINRISNKLMYTNIGFNLVPEQFTIKDLELSYEAILGKHIPAFRRIMSDKVVETGLTTSDLNDKRNAYRPSKLFKLRTY